MHKIFIALTSGAALLLAGGAYAQDSTPETGVDLVTATATFMDADGNELGDMTLTETEEGVTIAGVLSGIPEGEHGFHIHETGSCDPSTGFESAGGHFNPTDAEHGFENPDGPHAGDMRNQMASADGEFVVNVNNDMVGLSEGRDGHLFDEDGSALMVHSGSDDYMTDPGGDAGDRIACAVIEPMP